MAATVRALVDAGEEDNRCDSGDRDNTDHTPRALSAEGLKEMSSLTTERMGALVSSFTHGDMGLGVADW